jgi:hypothetical protein
MEFAYLSYAENARDSRTTDCLDVTDRLFDKRKEANVLLQAGQIGTLFPSWSSVRTEPPTARWAVAPCHSLLTYFCIRAIYGDTLTSVQGRRRFFQSKGRRAADPKTAAVSIRHSLVRLDSAGQW